MKHFQMSFCLSNEIEYITWFFICQQKFSKLYIFFLQLVTVHPYCTTPSARKCRNINHFQTFALNLPHKLTHILHPGVNVIHPFISLRKRFIYNCWDFLWLIILNLSIDIHSNFAVFMPRQIAVLSSDPHQHESGL